MKNALKNSVARAGLIMIALLQTACQQGGNSASTSNTSETNSANASASAAPAPAAPDPSMATGPVALASDASLPAPCQEVVRAAQVCVDNLHSEGGARSAEMRAGYEQNVRQALRLARDTWALAPNEPNRSHLCALDLGAMQSSQRDYHCGPH